MCFYFFLHFAGLKGQYTLKLLLGLGNALKTNVFRCIKKNYKNATNEISNNGIKRYFGIFRLGKPRVANITPGIDSLRNFTSIIYF